jgi:hypothetical protein
MKPGTLGTNFQLRVGTKIRYCYMYENKDGFAYMPERGSVAVAVSDAGVMVVPDPYPTRGVATGWLYAKAVAKDVNVTFHFVDGEGKLHAPDLIDVIDVVEESATASFILYDAPEKQ